MSVNKFEVMERNEIAHLKMVNAAKDNEIRLLRREVEMLQHRLGFCGPRKRENISSK